MTPDSLWLDKLRHANDMTAMVAIVAIVIMFMFYVATLMGERGRQ